MKKRIGSILVTLCLLLSLLPGTALASPLYEDVYISVSSWADLQEAMHTIEKDEANQFNQPYRGILIKTDSFVWPSEGGELVIDYYDNQTTDYSITTNQKHRLDLYLCGSTWEIPENVTLTSYEYLRFDPFVDYSMNHALTVTVNGAMVFHHQGGMIHSGYGGLETTVELVINGSLTTSATYETSLDGVGVVLNGSLTCPHRFDCHDLTYNKSATVSLDRYDYITVSGELTLENGAKVDADIRLRGNRITANGSAEVGYVQLSKDATFTGNLTTGGVQLGDHTLTIPAGSNVSIERFSHSDGATVNVYGILNFWGGSSTFENSTLNIAEGGVVKMQPEVQFEGADANSTITGDGVLELHGLLRKRTYNYRDEEYTDFYCERAPRIFGVDSDRGDWSGDVFTYDELTGINESVTVRRMWDNCEHICGDGTVLAPTCGSNGYTYYYCDGCGSEIRWDYTQATEKHTPTYEKENDNRVSVECSVCESSGSITITAEDGQYNNGTPVETARLEAGRSLSYWVDFTLPEITYTNNTQIGTATASATFGDVTISTTFEIVSCAHTGGTATCQQKAICTKCSQPYGDYAGHTEGIPATCSTQAVCTVCSQSYGAYADHSLVIKHNDTIHWVACEGCNLAWMEDFGIEESDPNNIQGEVFFRTLQVYVEMGNATVDQLRWFEMYYGNGPEHTDDNGVCLLCGYGAVATTPMYRLYNPNSGEHFYTGSLQEKDSLVIAGWTYEGIAWNAPTDSGDSVHRLFNPNNSDHHYTMSAEEKDMLVGVGWIYEGICWNSAPADHPDSMGLYRLYNPNADCGSHHYTGSEEEKNMLETAGWIYEGIGWHGMLQ